METVSFTSVNLIFIALNKEFDDVIIPIDIQCYINRDYTEFEIDYHFLKNLISDEITNNIKNVKDSTDKHDWISLDNCINILKEMNNFNKINIKMEFSYKKLSIREDSIPTKCFEYTFIGNKNKLNIKCNNKFVKNYVDEDEGGAAVTYARDGSLRKEPENIEVFSIEEIIVSQVVNFEDLRISP
jgi:hypothetical protein